MYMTETSRSDIRDIDSYCGFGKHTSGATKLTFRTPAGVRRFTSIFKSDPLHWHGRELRLEAAITSYDYEQKKVMLVLLHIMTVTEKEFFEPCMPLIKDWPNYIASNDRAFIAVIFFNNYDAKFKIKVAPGFFSYQTTLPNNLERKI